MNYASTLESAEVLLREQTSPLEGALALLASRSKKSAREVSPPVEDVFRGAATALDQMLVTLIEKRTRDEYDAAFAEVFPKYAALTVAVSHIARAIVPEASMERLTREAICELEADFREGGTAAFGSAVKEQAMFTIWTVRQISEIVSKIYGAKVNEEKKKEDREYCVNFVSASLEGQFGLDCLSTALQHHRPIYPDVMERVTNNLRSMVNAYAWVRRGLALRLPPQEELSDAQDQDDRDEGMLDLSVRGLAELDDSSASDAA